MAQISGNKQLESHLVTVEKQQCIPQAGTSTYRLCNLLAQKSLPVYLFLMALVKMNNLYLHIFINLLPNSFNSSKCHIFFYLQGNTWVWPTLCQYSLLLFTCYRTSTETSMVIITFLVIKNNERSTQLPHWSTESFSYAIYLWHGTASNLGMYLKSSNVQI